VALDHEEHYGYMGCNILCGHCGSIMNGSESVQTRHSHPMEYRVVCQNVTCPHNGILYSVGAEARISLTRVSLSKMKKIDKEKES
jgi:hypothetical protein